MAKWTGIALVGLWACLGIPAQAQQAPGYPPAPVGQPLPIGPAPLARPNVIVGPLRGKDVPPGPDEALGLPKGPNAWAGEYQYDFNDVVDGGWRVSGGVLFLSPHFKNLTALTVQTPDGVNAIGFDYQTKAAPWLELEYVWNSGWGVRARGWALHCTAPTVHFVNYPGPTTGPNPSYIPLDPVPIPLLISPVLIPGGTPLVKSASPLPGFQLVSPNQNDIKGSVPTTTVTALTRTVDLFFPPTTIPDSLVAVGLGKDVIYVGSKLDLAVFDLEATRYSFNSTFNFMISAGLRYGAMTQSYRAVRVNPDTPGRFEIAAYNANEPAGDPDFDPEIILYDRDYSTVDYVRRFEGIGPTVLIETRLPLATSGISLYANARAATMLGRRTEDAFYTKSLVGRLGICEGNSAPIDQGNCAQSPGPVMFPFEVTQSLRSSVGITRFQPVFGFEAGGEWDFPQGSPHWVLQAAFVNQYWVGAGNPTSTNGTMALYGMKLALGIQY